MMRMRSLASEEDNLRVIENEQYLLDQIKESEEEGHQPNDESLPYERQEIEVEKSRASRTSRASRAGNEKDKRISRLKEELNALLKRIQ